MKLPVDEGISIVCSFLFPSPDETNETLQETKTFIEELSAIGVDKFVPAITTPFPGTELYDKADELGLKFLTHDWDEYNLNTPVVTTKNFDVHAIREGYMELVHLSLIHTKAPKRKSSSPLKDPVVLLQEYMRKKGVNLRIGQRV